MIIDIQALPNMQRMAWLQHAIAPRPICFASTVDANGNANLSPFSFFNLFSSNPPIVIFSPSRKGTDGSLKHTLQNIQEHPEVVINICDFEMVQQISLSSCEFAKGVDEFTKAGFTKETATIVKVPMVKESKLKLECKVNEIKSLGNEGGAGQLVIAEVLCMHIADDILTADKTMIDQTKLQLIARLGGDYYCKIDSTNLFTVAKPNKQLGIGIDALPIGIKTSKILSGNNLGQLANVSRLPIVDTSFFDNKAKNIVQYYSINPEEMEQELHRYAKELLDNNETEKAWQILLVGENV